MKSINEYITEGLLSGQETTLQNGEAAIRKIVADYVNKYFETDGRFIISVKPNKKGLFEVSADDDVNYKSSYFNSIRSLTNGMFVWAKIDGDFNCHGILNLESLEGSPKIVNGDFDCSCCPNLKSLEGGPEIVERNYLCYKCEKLQSLEGASTNECTRFYCHSCSNLKTLKGAPKKVSFEFDCSSCPNLKSLEGGPEKVGTAYVCKFCDSLKSLEGGPKDVPCGTLDCSYCKSLKSLKGVNTDKIYVRSKGCESIKLNK